MSGEVLASRVCRQCSIICGVRGRAFLAARECRGDENLPLPTAEKFPSGSPRTALSPGGDTQHPARRARTALFIIKHFFSPCHLSLCCGLGPRGTEPKSLNLSQLFPDTPCVGLPVGLPVDTGRVSGARSLSTVADPLSTSCRLVLSTVVDSYQPLSTVVNPSRCDALVDRSSTCRLLSACRLDTCRLVLLVVL